MMVEGWGEGCVFGGGTVFQEEIKTWAERKRGHVCDKCPFFMDNDAAAALND